jgi:hypothetical protein
VRERDNFGALKIELRKLYERHPKEFERVLEEIDALRHSYPLGDDDPFFSKHFSETAARIDWVLPPIDFVRGKPSKVSWISLARLLIEYRYWQAHGVSRDTFCADMAETQFELSNGYRITRLVSEGNVADYLKAAEKKERADRDFASLVNTMVKYLFWRDTR